MEENPRLIKQTQQPSAHLPCACSGAPSCKAPFALLCVLNAKYVHAAPAPYCLAAGVSAFAPDISVAVCEGTVNEGQDVVLARLLGHEAQVLTFSCYIWNITETLALCAAIKAARPQTVLVLGGPEVSYRAKDVLLHNACVDYILAGEGEESVPALLSALQTGQKPKDIAGLCCRTENGVQISAPAVLKGTPPTPYTGAYKNAIGGRIAYLETSRGCPYACAFCLSGACGAPRYFALDGVYENILALATSGTQTVKLVDRTFNANARHANAILRFILAHYGKEIPDTVCFHFEIAGDILTQEMLDILKSAPRGAFQLEIGIQSLSEKTLLAVRRKTDTARLLQNLRALIAMRNMHIHIDLIAGLPQEDLAGFIDGFNRAYALGADMLQMGFLKRLSGSAMANEPQAFPMQCAPTPPYEVQETPWLCAADIAALKSAEDALERLYNSGRFIKTLEYVLNATGLTPYALFAAVGAAAPKTTLDAYIAQIQACFTALAGVNVALLRDAMVEDVLTATSLGKLPAALRVPDERLKQAVRAFAENPHTAPRPGVKRAVALLYGCKSMAFVDYTQKDAATGRYTLFKMRIDF